MAKINVKGLGVIQIEGDKPSAQEIEIIQKLIEYENQEDYEFISGS